MWGGSHHVWKRRFSCYDPWETAESCVVRSQASVYRRLPGMSPWGTPPPQTPPLPTSCSSPPASGRPLKSESEDSGVEMGSTELSPQTPVSSESSFSLDGCAARSGVSREPPRTPPRSRSASKKLVLAAQRSRRQRAPARCPRQLGQHSASGAQLQHREEAKAEDPDDAKGVLGVQGAHSPPSPRACPHAVPGQGLRYLEHVCQMLERLARLQQDNRLLRQQAAGARHNHPDTTPAPDPAAWRGERFRPRSCSDSQTPAPGPEPCRRTWGHSASSPSLLEPSESGAGAPTADKDGRSHWGRVKVLLTRLTRRSLRGGQCR